MPQDQEGNDRPSYSEVVQAGPWLELSPAVKDERECNLCCQPLDEVKSKELSGQLFYCPACKTIKAYFENRSIRIVINSS